MKNIVIIFGLVFIFASALSLSGCGDNAKTEAEKSGEMEDVRARSGPADSPQAKARAKIKAKRAEAMAGREAFSTVRMDYVRRKGLPTEYRALTAPTEGSWRDDLTGRDLYKKNCSSCHGGRANGNGVMGRALTPPASDLIRVMRASEVTDSYLFWATTEGGRALGTAMPSFKDLSKEDRWLIVAALRKGLR